MIPLPNITMLKLVYYKSRELIAKTRDFNAKRKENQPDTVPDAVRERIAFDQLKLATSETRAPVEHITIDQIFSRVNAGYYKLHGIHTPEDMPSSESSGTSGTETTTGDSA